MELTDYLRLLVRRWWLFVLPVVVFGLLFGIYGYRQPISYDGFSSLSFVKPNEAPAGNSRTDYHFDSYYNLQAGQLLSSEVHGWLADATFITEIYNHAQVTLPGVTIPTYSRMIEVKPLPGATLLVKTNALTAAEAEKLAASATKLVKSRLDQLSNDGLTDPVIVIVGAPLHQTHSPNSALILVAGLIVGVLIGLISVGLAQTFWPIQI